MKVLMRGFITVFVLLLCWQLLVMLFHFPPYILPSPVLVFHSFATNLLLIAHQALPTIFEAVVGFVWATLFATLGALLLMYFRPARRWFLPVLLVSQALPTFAIAPLFVMWFGYGVSSKIATTILMVFFPITSSFYDGMRRTPKGYLDLARTMNAKKWKILWCLQVPAALPSLGSGLRLAAIYAPMGAVIGEWVGASRGLGFLILNANARMQIALMFAALFTLVILALAFYFMVDRCFKRWVNWS
jgi:putative hydroxymethylpyrimidine transport system permease protein